MKLYSDKEGEEGTPIKTIKIERIEGKLLFDENQLQGIDFNTPYKMEIVYGCKKIGFSNENMSYKETVLANGTFKILLENKNEESKNDAFESESCSNDEYEHSDIIIKNCKFYTFDDEKNSKIRRKSKKLNLRETIINSFFNSNNDNKINIDD